MDARQSKAPGRNGYRYREQYGVIVLCKDERDQEKTYNELKRLGRKCRVVTV